MTSTYELQRTLYSTLSNVLSIPVYDEVPEGVAMPYVVIGDLYETGDPSHDVDGRQVLVTIHVWSNYAGAREAREISGQIIGALQFQELAVSGFRPVPFALDFFDVLRDPSGTYRHGVVRFRAWLRSMP